jgi:DNA modification methylase
MIEMWDETFCRQSREVRRALENGEAMRAFEAMHQVLDPVWSEAVRAVKPGGLLCINIGDATRTVGDRFMLYPNHARIFIRLLQEGLTPLPAVIWRKQTNAPNKFMGSGMLPAGAYVTLEHEYVLIARKGGRRQFDTPGEKAARRRSAVFWEERNAWFSDVWMDLKGARQQMLDRKVRERSGAFPFELPYRLINMYSVAGDTILDPFAGAGTTLFAAMAAARNSIGFELAEDLSGLIRSQLKTAAEAGNSAVSARLESHAAFAAGRLAAGKPVRYTSRFYGFPVVTRQETDICLPRPLAVRQDRSDHFSVTYAAEPPDTDWYGSEAAQLREPGPPAAQSPQSRPGPAVPKQQDLFSRG